MWGWSFLHMDHKRSDFLQACQERNTNLRLDTELLVDRQPPVDKQPLAPRALLAQRRSPSLGLGIELPLCIQLRGVLQQQADKQSLHALVSLLHRVTGSLALRRNSKVDRQPQSSSSVCRLNSNRLNCKKSKWLQLKTRRMSPAR